MDDPYEPDPYPEHTRQNAILEQAQAIGDFLENTGYVLAEYQKFDGWGEPRLFPVSTPTQQILAKHFEIDLDKIEAEKREMLGALDALND